MSLDWLIVISTYVFVISFMICPLEMHEQEVLVNPPKLFILFIFQVVYHPPIKLGWSLLGYFCNAWCSCHWFERETLGCMWSKCIYLSLWVYVWLYPKYLCNFSFLQLGLPYFPSDFPDCDAYSSFMAAEATATDQMAELRPPAKRSFRVPIPPPWNSVGVTFSKVSIAAQDTNLSHIKNVVDGSLLSELGSEKSNLTASGCHDSSSNKMVARTSTMLASFLSDIHCDHLLLFPQVPEGNTSILTCMKDENMLSRGQKRISQIHYDRKLCFLRVLLHAYKEGVFEDGAVVCAPCLGDISLWTSR